MLKQTAINLVSNNLSSLFTKEDVINLIKLIDAGPHDEDETETDEVNEITFTDETLDELIEHVANSIGGLYASDVVDKDSAQFSIDGRDTIVLDEVDIDTSCIEDAVTESIKEFFDNLKEDVPTSYVKRNSQK